LISVLDDGGISGEAAKRQLNVLPQGKEPFTLCSTFDGPFIDNNLATNSTNG